MKHSDSRKNFETVDLASASFLAARGCQPKFDIQNRQIIFKFNDPAAPELFRQWNAESTPEKSFFENYLTLRRSVKNLLGSNQT